MELITKKEVQLIENNINLDDLSEEELRQYIYSKGFYDKQFFFEYFFPHLRYFNGNYIKSAEFHKEIDEKYSQNINFALLVPRKHAKTTKIMVNILHELLYETGSDLLYVSSAALGQKVIGDIRIELELNENLYQVFGSKVPKDSDSETIRKRKKWKQQLLELNNGNSIETLTQRGAVRGGLKKKVIIDDPQENKDVRTKRVKDEFNYHMKSSIYNVMLPGGNMIVLGTVLSNDCFVLHTINEMGFDSIQYEACDDNFENILWPEMWTKEALKERKEVVGTEIFNQEYRNIPHALGESIISANRIKYEEIPRDGKLIMGIDPAFSEKTNSDSMALTLSVHKGEYIYILDSIEFNGAEKNEENFVKYVENLYNRYTNYSSVMINVEANNGGEIIGRQLKSRNLPVQILNATRDKVTRLREFQGKFERGEIYFNKERMSGNLREQLVYFPNSEKDDLVDSLVWSLKGGNIEISFG